MMITTAQKFKLRKFIKELEIHRGRHTELVSVYVPTGYDMNKIIGHLNQEQGTASNIKSSSTRKNVIDALERMIQHLRTIGRTPANGLAVFSGNVAEREGQQDFQVWSIEPPVPLKIRIYRCDKQFVLEHLAKMIEDKDAYGLVVMDRREADLAFLKGKSIVELSRARSNVPGKTRAGGQCCVKGTQVQSANGDIIKIEDCHNPLKIKSMNMSNQLIEDSQITDKWKAKKQKIIKIITKNPQITLETSKDHIFFVSTNKGFVERSAEELKTGDLLIMPEKIDVKGKIQKIESKKYYNSFIISKDGQKLLEQNRLKKGLFQKQLAKKVGLTQTAISSYEIGKRNINSEVLKRVCCELGLSFEDFIKRYTKPFLYRNIKLPTELNKGFAQFLGYLIGDGCIERDRVTFFEQNKKLALIYKKKFDTYFRIKSSYRFRKSKNYHQLRFTSRPLVRLILSEFPEIKNALNSEIPTKILKSNNKIIASFLRGLFDAEGYSSQNQRVGIGMNNGRIIKQMQMLLLRFSIISSVIKYKYWLHIRA